MMSNLTDFCHHEWVAWLQRQLFALDDDDKLVT